MAYPGTYATVMAQSKPREHEKVGLPLVLILTYVVMEYARPANPMKIPMVISIVLFLSWLALGKKNWCPQVVCFLLLLAVIAVMGPFAINNFSIWVGFRLMTIQLLCICVPIIHFAATIHKWDVLCRGLIAVYVYVGLYGLLHGGIGPGGHIGDENDLALALNTMMPLAFFSMFVVTSRAWKLVSGVAFVLMAAGVVASFSRGGFLGLATVLLYCFVISPRKKLAVVLAIFLGIGASMFAPDTYWKEIASIKEAATDTEQGTGALRREYWTIAWNMFLHNPVLGVGLDNFPWNVPEYQSEEQHVRAERSYAGAVAHSLYFTLVAELGLAGALIFLSLLWFNFRDLRAIARTGREWAGRQGGGREGAVPRAGEAVARDLDKARYYAHALAAGFLGYLISGFFLSVFTYPHMWVLTALTAALKESVRKKVEEVESDPVGLEAPAHNRPGDWGARSTGAMVSPCEQRTSVRPASYDPAAWS